MKDITIFPMKRAMEANHTQKHDYLMASSMWPLKNKL